LQTWALFAYASLGSLDFTRLHQVPALFVQLDVVALAH